MEGQFKNVTFRCVAAARRELIVPIIENITPPMPAKRALAALDQPAPTDIGPPKRISKKVRAAIDAMVSGECKNICDAAAKAGLARESLSRALSTPHVAEHLRQKVLRHLAIHAARAGEMPCRTLREPNTPLRRPAGTDLSVP